MWSSSEVATLLQTEKNVEKSLIPGSKQTYMTVVKSERYGLTLVLNVFFILLP